MKRVLGSALQIARPCGTGRFTLGSIQASKQYGVAPSLRSAHDRVLTTRAVPPLAVDIHSCNFLSLNAITKQDKVQLTTTLVDWQLSPPAGLLTVPALP